MKKAGVIKCRRMRDRDGQSKTGKLGKQYLWKSEGRGKVQNCLKPFDPAGASNGAAEGNRPGMLIRNGSVQQAKKERV